MALPGKGETVTIRDWNGNNLTIQVSGHGESKEFGPTIEGHEIEAGHSFRFRAFPADHLVKAVNIHRAGHGKWDVLFPEGEERVGSHKKALDLIGERGYTLGMEV